MVSLIKNILTYAALHICCILITNTTLAQSKTTSMDLYINFETRSAEVSNNATDVINEVADMMQKNPNIKIRLEGHTDNVGIADSNMAISERRAIAVMQAVIKKGIDPKRLSVKGWGDTHPLADNNTADSRARNRRVEIIVIE